MKKVVEVGEDVTFVCPPSSTTLWTFNNGSLLPDNVYGSTNELLIKNVILENQGMYTCETDKVIASSRLIVTGIYLTSMKQYLLFQNIPHFIT